MQQQVAMNRNLSRLECVIDGLAELLGSGHCLIQDVGFIVFAKRIREVPQKVRTRNESHARVLHVGIVNRKPRGYRLRMRKRPTPPVSIARPTPARALSTTVT